MSGPLAGRRVVLGVSGSIASYKAAELCSRLVQEGAHVEVVMTSGATEFIAPLSFRALTGRRPYIDLYRDGNEGESHVELARRADLMLIAPASASTLARLTHGLAEDFVSLTAIATQAPVLVAPAMDSQMWEHPAVQANRATLEERGVQFLGPVSGRLASGRSGSGRLMEPAEMVEHVKARLGREHGDLAGRTVVVSAGGTREAIDPVRYVGNRSSGKMGYALAEAARDRGASVVLVTSAGLPKPAAIEVVSVESAAEMLDAVQTACKRADALIMAAAVADYRPAEAADQKLKKVAGQSGRTIELVETTDIIASVQGERLVKVAFAAETQDLLENAQKKLASKGARFVVANDVTAADAGFAVDTNRVTILDDQGGREALPLMMKYDVAWRVLDRVVALLPVR
ncbi:MAG: bifunctional phosphopantothenoylcysteine decarboxylase/phosphopantothenate--cysteine ligase CoaBC [Dehalococcoidia bacterium]